MAWEAAVWAMMQDYDQNFEFGAPFFDNMVHPVGS
jgi:hypothetical protein